MDGVKRTFAHGSRAVTEHGVKRGARVAAEVGVTAGRPPAWFFVWFLPRCAIGVGILDIFCANADLVTHPESV
jgi:hypothetical protein